MTGARRSWLFIPGDSEKMIGKSSTIDADALVFDLEDAVVETRKDAARRTVADHLANAPRGRSERWVRINALDTAHAMEDLRVVMAARPQGIVLPKVEQAEDGEALAGHIATLEAEHGIEPGSTRILLIAVETARGLLGIGGYRSVHARVAGLSWGAVDLSATLGALSNVDEQGRFTAPYELARTLTLVAAGACGVQAVDTAFLDFRDDAGLRRDCLLARRDGFLGKIAIHPAQVPVINEAFSPGKEEVAHARAVVKAFSDRPDAGSVSLDGKMLDKPHLLQAQRILGLAEAARQPVGKASGEA